MEDREDIKDNSWLEFDREIPLFNSTPWLNSNTIDWYTQVRNVLSSPWTSPYNNMIFQYNNDIRWLWITLNYNNTEKAFEIKNRTNSLHSSEVDIFSIWPKWDIIFWPVPTNIVNIQLPWSEWIIIWWAAERLWFFWELCITQPTTPVNYPSSWTTLAQTQACLDDLISKLQSLWLIA